MTVSRSIHVSSNGKTSFFVMVEQYSIVCMCHIFFIHSSVDEHLGCLHVVATVNSAAINSGVHISFGIVVFSRYMPRSGIAGSYGGHSIGSSIAGLQSNFAAEIVANITSESHF